MTGGRWCAANALTSFSTTGPAGSSSAWKAGRDRSSTVIATSIGVPARPRRAGGTARTPSRPAPATTTALQRSKSESRCITDSPASRAMRALSERRRRELRRPCYRPDSLRARVTPLRQNVAPEVSGDGSSASRAQRARHPGDSRLQRGAATPSTAGAYRRPGPRARSRGRGRRLARRHRRGRAGRRCDRAAPSVQPGLRGRAADRLQVRARGRRELGRADGRGRPARPRPTSRACSRRSPRASASS